MPHVLVAFDDSTQAMTALEYALDHHTDARITALTVLNPIDAGYSTEAAIPTGGGEWYESEKQAAENRFEEADDLAAEYDAELETEIEVGRPSRTIVRYAEENDVDHIVMGSHGRSGVARVLLGSVAETVVRRSPVPVTVVR